MKEIYKERDGKKEGLSVRKETRKKQGNNERN